MRLLFASLFAAALVAQTKPESVTATLQVHVRAACELASVQTRIDFPTPSTQGTVLTGSTRVRYWLRTSRHGGEGSVSLRFQAPIGSKVSIRSSETGLGNVPVINDAPADRPIVVFALGANQHTPRTGTEAVVQWRITIPPDVLPFLPLPSASIRCR